MKTAKNSIFLFSLLIVFILSSCRETIIEQEINKCNSNPCGNLSGFSCVEGACLCLKGKYQMGVFCQALNQNEYYGTSSCSYLDTIRIDFGQAQQTDERISTVLLTRAFGTQMNGLRYKDNNQNLDSLVFTFPNTYMKDTIECRVLARGRFLDSTQLKLNLKYFAIHQNSRFVSSCDMVLHK